MLTRHLRNQIQKFELIIICCFIFADCLYSTSMSMEAMLIDLLDIQKPLQHLEESELPSSRATYSWLTRTGADLLDRIGIDCNGDCAGMFLRLLNDAGLGHRPDIASLPRMYTKSPPVESDKIPSAPVWRNDSANFNEEFPSWRNDVPAPSFIESNIIPSAPQWRNDSANFNDVVPTWRNDIPEDSTVDSAPQWRNDAANLDDAVPTWSNDLQEPTLNEFESAGATVNDNDLLTLPGQLMESRNLATAPMWNNDEVHTQSPTVSENMSTASPNPYVEAQSMLPLSETKSSKFSSRQPDFLKNSAMDPAQESTQSNLTAGIN